MSNSLSLKTFHFPGILLPVSIVILFLFHSLPAQTGEKKLKVLIITGGHDFEREPFFAMVKSFPGIDYQEAQQPRANTLYAAPEITNYDVLVFYDMVQDITDDQKAAFVRLLKNGKGIVFLHHALASYQDWDEFEVILGGHYYLKPRKKNNETFVASTYKHDVDMPVTIIDPDHPVTAGIKDFSIHDEVYGSFTVLPVVHPLLATTHPESGDIIGWSNSYGKSRIVYLQLGHDHHAYENPNYRQLVRQAIAWVANKN